MASQQSHSFDIPAARAIVRDFFHHRAAFYWIDFALSMVVAYTAASIYLSAPWFSLAQLLFFPIATFGLFRLGSFIHEVVHMPRGVMPGFRVVWNLLAGVPMLSPSFFYGNHLDHHRPHRYGTRRDGEYLPLAYGTMKNVALFMGQNIYLPALIFLRFAVLTPLSFLHGGLRQWTLERASSFIMNFSYRREITESAPRTAWAWLEVLCCLRAQAIIVFVLIGVTPWSRLPALYLLAMSTLSLNYLRNLVAHHYRGTGEEMTHADQLSDSINITGHPLWTELFFPIGLRYHALHHLFPTIPYHNLGQAHRRLMARLPADSEYRRTTYPSFASAWRELRADMRQAVHHAPRDVSGWHAAALSHGDDTV